MESDKEELVELLNSLEVIKFGKFTLSSGKESDYYVDMKKAITNPHLLSLLGKMISKRIEELGINKIAGPALGAVPIATSVSLYSKLPMLMIRKEKKDYGTSKLIEGELNPGDRVIVVEDVTTTGNSLLKAINAIHDNGGVVIKSFVAVDREEGAIEHLKNNEVDLEALVSISDFR